MSSPEALQEYSQEHAGDVDDIMQHLREKKDPKISDDELRDAYRALSLETTAQYRGSCFTITRDYANHYYLTEEHWSEERAA